MVFMLSLAASTSSDFIFPADEDHLVRTSLSFNYYLISISFKWNVNQRMHASRMNASNSLQLHN